MEKNEKMCYSFTLKEVSEWGKINSFVEVPAYQRGLVWKPHQVELLWDSIFRGFPIGGFILSEHHNNTNQYYLMDGQQRCNAISLGFTIDDIPKSVLWIDLEPNINNIGSTRIFWFKLTTISHPWGYNNNDEASRLSSFDKREALELFHISDNIYEKDIPLKNSWPIKANLPIPLCCILSAIEDCTNEQDFENKTIEEFRKLEFSYFEEFSKKFKESVIASNYLKKELYIAIKNILKTYIVTCSYLSNETLTINNISEKDEKKESPYTTNIETLYSRLNTGGTPISRDDLLYSAIKVYWPDIKEKNDNLSKKYMNPAKLVSFVFRLALTDKKDERLKGEMTISQIRQKASDNDIKRIILSLYENDIVKNILEKIDCWLGFSDNGYDKTPIILRTKIINSSPDIYLLLMFFAKESIETNLYLHPRNIRAIAFLLHWFTPNKNKKDCVNIIFKQCKKEISIENLKKGISLLRHGELFIYPYSTNDLSTKKLLTFYKNKDKKNFDLTYSFLKQSFGFSEEAKEMLLYAEKEYINKTFPLYDPAILDMWSNENSPWDFDHIVPVDFVKNRKGSYREFDYIWLWCIGNIAAISFMANRSKGASTECDVYNEYKSVLCYQKEFEDINSDLTFSQEQSNKFAEVTCKRYLELYKRVYSSLEPILDPPSLAQKLANRKETMTSVGNIINNAGRSSHFFKWKDEHYLPMNIDNTDEWTTKWIAIGFFIDDFMICFEWTGETKGNDIAHIGICVQPQKEFNEDNFNKLAISEKQNLSDNYWYSFKDLSNLDLEHDNAHVIADNMLELINLVRE